MNNANFRELWEDDQLELIESKSDPSYRHGCYRDEVYKDPDGFYWSVKYTVSGDGEENGIRDGEFYIQEVYPVEEMVKVTKWFSKQTT